MPVKENADIKFEGISGRDQICTLPAFDILEIIEEPEEPKEPDTPPPSVPRPPEPPLGGGSKEYLDWFMKVIEWYKETF